MDRRASEWLIHNLDLAELTVMKSWKSFYLFLPAVDRSNCIMAFSEQSAPPSVDGLNRNWSITFGWTSLVSDTSQTTADPPVEFVHRLFFIPFLLMIFFLEHVGLNLVGCRSERDCVVKGSVYKSRVSETFQNPFGNLFVNNGPLLIDMRSTIGLRSIQCRRDGNTDDGFQMIPHAVGCRLNQVADKCRPWEA